jgi:hypothetical protein
MGSPARDCSLASWHFYSLLIGGDLAARQDGLALRIGLIGKNPSPCWFESLEGIAGAPACLTNITLTHGILRKEEFIAF